MIFVKNEFVKNRVGGRGSTSIWIMSLNILFFFVEVTPYCLILILSRCWSNQGEGDLGRGHPGEHGLVPGEVGALADQQGGGRHGSRQVQDVARQGAVGDVSE